MTPSGEERVPRVLEVRLGPDQGAGGLSAVASPWASADPQLEALGRASGPALGLARYFAPDAPAPGLVLCVGDSVRRGLPTAARVSILGVSPLTGRLAEGQVGSDLGRRLARITDALVLAGRAAGKGTVLRIDEHGGALLLSMPELVGTDPATVLEHLRDRFGDCAVLCCGPAGEREVPFANLAAGGRTPHFVGRGGLGARLGGLGLKAVVVCAAPVAPREDDALTRILLASPRLQARSAGGTLELAHAFAARGDLHGRGHSQVLDVEAGAELSRAARLSGKERHGCKGCPTPCGWIFERGDGKRQGAHFSAVYALGTNLGLSGFDDALVLLDACDRLGLDAKEAGAGLALLASAVEQGRVSGDGLFGNRDALLQSLDEIVEGHGRGALLARGAAAFAESQGLADEAHHAAGEAARPESSLASVLGQCVSARGAEPMRSFPFLLGDGAPVDRVRRLLDPFELPEHAQDPRHPAGKGRLVWWHENLVAALDVSGFCAFSAAGLLADGLLDLDGLAEVLALPTSTVAEPSGEDRAVQRPGLALLELGARVIALHHLWNERAGIDLDDRPDWAAAALAEPGMLDEYRRWRGLDGGGRRLPDSWPEGECSPLEFAEAESCSAIPRAGSGRSAASTEPQGHPSEPPRRSPGSVTLTGWGPLRTALGGTPTVGLELPAPVAEVLRAAARAHPDAAAWLWAGEQPVPGVYRDRERLDADALVHDGDLLDLVVAVSGGSP